jgi:hypothetical protein
MDSFSFESFTLMLLTSVRVIVAGPRSASSNVCEDRRRSYELSRLITYVLLISTRVNIANPESTSGDSHGDWHNTPGTLKVTSSVNCTAPKTVLAYSSSSPGTRTRVDWRNFDSCRVGLIELKPSSCMALDASVGSFLHAAGTEIISVERVCYVYRANQCC